MRFLFLYQMSLKAIKMAFIFLRGYDMPQRKNKFALFWKEKNNYALTVKPLSAKTGNILLLGKFIFYHNGLEI